MIELSFSRVQTFERCPWMYHLVYDLGWRSGPTDRAAVGKSVHLTLAAYLGPQNTEYTLDRLYEFYDQFWVNEGFSGPQETFEAYERGRAMLHRFFETDDRAAGVVEGTEKEFELLLAPDVRLRGTVDRLDRRSDGAYEVVEYKTQAEAWPQARVDADRQMTFYALGLGQTLGPVPLRLRFHFVAAGISVVTERSAAQIEEARTLLMNVADRLRRGDQTPNHDACDRCEFRRRCDRAKPLK